MSKLDIALAILNGTVGDYLERSGNGLATAMTFAHGGAPLACSRAAIAAAYPDATGKIVVLLHGVMNTESVFDFAGGEGDYGAMLARDQGYTPLYVRYNSGRSIVANGRSLAELLDAIEASYPVPIESIVLLGYSMGGLIARSACTIANREGKAWLTKIHKAIYVGTPHLGAPLERGGRTLTKILSAIPDPYTRLIAELGDLRSAGIKDLGDAVCDEPTEEMRQVELLPGIRHYFVAGALSQSSMLDSIGDVMVPVASGTCATGAELRVKVIRSIDHVRMAHDLQVYEFVSECCKEEVP